MGGTLIDSNMGNVILTAASNRAQILERSSAEEFDVYYIIVDMIT